MRRSFFLLALSWFVLPATVGSAFASGCGPSIDTVEQGGGGVGGLGTGAGSTTSGTISTGGKDGGKDALPDYVDPGCPDAGPPLMLYDCDPFNQGNGDCGPGEGCFIYVDYPNEPCGQETYGAVCIPEGFGHQGDACNGGQDCAGGFVCVVSGSGNQCIELCHIVGPNECPPGLVCEPIDVEGFGGCL